MVDQPFSFANNPNPFSHLQTYSQNFLPQPMQTQSQQQVRQQIGADLRGIGGGNGGGGGPARGPGTPAQMIDPSQQLQAMMAPPIQSPSLTLTPSMQGLHQPQVMIGQRRLQEIPGMNGGLKAQISGFYDQTAQYMGVQSLTQGGAQIGREPQYLPILQEKESNEVSCIKNVYFENLETELPKITELLDKFPFIAMDTEFPGVIYYDYLDQYKNSEQREYLRIKQNIDCLKLIQIGITLSDENGKLPEPVSTWQFNFNFDIDSDLKSNDSINILKESGIDFQKLKIRGMDPTYFAEKVIQSGLVLNDRIHWICFHGNQDFAYLLKTLSNDYLPVDRKIFQNHLNLFFPHVYDIKTISPYLSPHFEGLGLNRLAESLGIQRIGNTHQAGSDSLTTSKLYFKMKQTFPQLFNQVVVENNGDIYGYQNDQAYIRPPQSAPSSAINIPDPISNGYEDPDAIAAETQFYYQEYDQPFGFQGVNPALVSASGHGIDLGYPSVSQVSRGNYQLHQYHNSQSMHHDHIGKNHPISKANIVDPSFVGSNIGRSGLHLSSSTPQPMDINGQFNLRNLNSATGTFNAGYAPGQIAQDQYQAHNQWAFGFGQGSQSFTNGYYQ